MAGLLTDQLRLMADAYPDKVAYRNVDSGDRVTFAGWEAESSRLATRPVGEIGEVITRNPAGHREYYKDAVATAEMWRGGWLHSNATGKMLKRRLAELIADSGPALPS